ncbi:DUF2867 domain-containing protein [Deltaproteobacteria bacterium]|nr:DUF2867 domain-containing protein [Deltaproteobacteria bacterium]
MIKKIKELDIYFQDIDYSEVKTIEGSKSLREFIAKMLSYYPWWILLLYQIREILVIAFGLVKHEKPDKLPSIAPEDVSFRPGDNVSFFMVSKAEEDLYWVAETPEDKHLIAYFGIVPEKLENGLTKFHVFTSVKYKHWTGSIYFNLIRPFHHLVVYTMMKAGISK